MFIWSKKDNSGLGMAMFLIKVIIGYMVKERAIMFKP